VQDCASKFISDAADEIIARLLGAGEKRIPLGISNRHVHLCRRDLDILFGEGYELTELRPLSQPGQYAAKETVCIAGLKGCFNSVRVLGPVRPESQIEISRTDAFALGSKPPLRLSGDTAGSASLCVIGPAGMLVMREGVIIARRHIHMSSEDAKTFGVKDCDTVAVEAESERSCVYRDVVVRVSKNFALELHLDTDEANAADLKNGSLFKIQA
jgi:putative phosphotransacetylase